MLNSSISAVPTEDIELLVLGAVTTGTVWRFLKLKSDNLQIDLEEYSIREIDKILGILRT